MGDAVKYQKKPFCLEIATLRVDGNGQSISKKKKKNSLTEK